MCSARIIRVTAPLQNFTHDLRGNHSNVPVQWMVLFKNRQQVTGWTVKYVINRRHASVPHPASRNLPHKDEIEDDPPGTKTGRHQCAEPKGTVIQQNSDQFQQLDWGNFMLQLPHWCFSSAALDWRVKNIITNTIKTCLVTVVHFHHEMEVQSFSLTILTCC